MKIKAKRPTPLQRPIKDLISEYRGLSEQMKILENRKAEIADEIKERAVLDGVQDQNGNYYSTCGDYVYGRQARKSVKVNFDRTKELLVKKKMWGFVCDTKEVINEDNLAKLVSKGKLSVSEFENLCDVKVTYCIDVHEKEPEKEDDNGEMPEVVQTNSKDSKRRIFKK